MDNGELLQLIRKAARDGRAELRLHDSEITELPSEIGMLTKLRLLDLSGNKLSELPREIGMLTQLEELYLDSNQLKNLPIEIGKLTQLRQLQLGRNFLSELPTEIGELSQLQHLVLQHNNLTRIPKEIGKLAYLSTLALHRNKLTALPPEIGQLKQLRLITATTNPLITPPIEVAELGTNAIQNYFDALAKSKGQTQYLFESKLLIIGDGGSGKTSFRKKIVNPDADMPQDKDTTLGIEVADWSFPTQFTINNELSDIDFRVNIWDFGGQKLYRGTHQIFFSAKCYYVLVADTREQGTDFSYWLNTVKQLAGKESSVLILLNKKHGHEFKFNERGYRSHFGNIIKDVVTLDLSKDKGKILDLQDKVRLHLKDLPGIGDALPLAWVQIREELLKEDKNFITFELFQNICQKYGINNEGVIKTLSNYYTRIGVFTHYIDHPLLRDRIYLNSNWLVNTVYEVLDNDLVKAKEGRLLESEIKEIWTKQKIGFEFDRLTQLMQRFGLMYQVPGTSDYVVPEHLPTDQPYDDWPYATNADVLHFIYQFDKYMPQGLMSRLIVALHRHIENQKLVWHQGVNIALSGSHAEILETYGAENSYRIRIVGSNKIEFLAIIWEHFGEILGRYRNLNYKQLIPCTCGECTEADVPGFHAYDVLLKLRQKGKSSQCTVSGDSVSLDDLLKIVPSNNISEGISLSTREPIETLEEPQTELRTIEIFLASSFELKADRDKVDIWINHENKILVKKGIFLHLHLWENFLEAMSQTRLQDEYNNAVKNCDIFVSLFATKVGKYTEEEFEVAHKNFLKAGKPKYVYTYFKKVELDPFEMDENDFDSMKSFRKKLKELEHFPSKYTSADDLTRQLKLQLDKILEEIE